MAQLEPPETILKAQKAHDGAFFFPEPVWMAQEAPVGSTEYFEDSEGTCRQKKKEYVVDILAQGQGAKKPLRYTAGRGAHSPAVVARPR